MKQEDIEALIKPENQLEKSILADKDLIDGLLWGKPRNGHPEGEVALHVKHVLDNVDKYFKDDSDYLRLRFIAITHDSFKYKVDHDKPKFGKNHHAIIARDFAARFNDDKGTLDVIALHDEIYNSYMMIQRKNNVEGAENRVKNLIETLGDNFDLFVKFAKCDSETGDKELSCNTWFANIVKEKYQKEISL